MPLMMAEKKSIGELIFDKLNEYRSSLSLETLKWNSELYKSTLGHTFYQALLG